MVSVDAHSAYWERLRANPLTSFFIDFLDGQPGVVIPALAPSDTASIVCNLLDYVRRGDTTAAASLYQLLTTRQVRSDSPWLHNDFLVFAVVCTVRRFQLDSTWIRNVLQKRPDSEMEKSLINRSFQNLLAGNLNAREDLHQISLVYQVMAQQEQFDADRLHKMFAYLWRQNFPYFDSEFLNILSLRAIRIAFEVKGLVNPEDRFVAEAFRQRFFERTVRVSQVLTYTFFVIAILALGIAAAFYSSDVRVSRGLGTMAALGLGASFFADIRNWLATRVEKGLRRFWGYVPPAIGRR